MSSEEEMLGENDEKYFRIHTPVWRSKVCNDIMPTFWKRNTLHYKPKREKGQQCRGIMEHHLHAKCPKMFRKIALEL